MKKYLLKLGNVIAILLMFFPLTILALYTNQKIDTIEFIVLLILAILYDMYIYSTIQFHLYMEKKKELYEKVVNGKALESKTEENKLQYYKLICEEIIFNYFSNK